MKFSGGIGSVIQLRKRLTKTLKLIEDRVEAEAHLAGIAGRGTGIGPSQEDQVAVNMYTTNLMAAVIAQAWGEVLIRKHQAHLEQARTDETQTDQQEEQ